MRPGIVLGERSSGGHEMKTGVVRFSLLFFIALSGVAAAQQPACTYHDVSRIGTVDMTLVSTGFPLSAPFVNRLDSIRGVNSVDRLGRYDLRIYWDVAFDWYGEIWPEVLAACQEENRR